MFPYYPAPGVNPVIEFYAPLIWMDEVLFHATLQLSGYSLKKLQPLAPVTGCSNFLPETLRLLQERVDEQSERAISNETIAAVAGLAALEVSEFIQELGGNTDFDSTKKEMYV